MNKGGLNTLIYKRIKMLINLHTSSFRVLITLCYQSKYMTLRRRVLDYVPSKSIPLRPRSRPTGATKWPRLWTPATVSLVGNEKVGKDGWGEDGEPTQKSPLTDPGGG